MDGDRSGVLRTLDGAPGSFVVADQAHGVVLREWRLTDVADMVGLFDTPEMDRWTPLSSPFDPAAAKAYVERAHRLRESGGTLQLAITEDGEKPLGELILFESDEPGGIELAYAVGADFQGRGLTVRSIKSVLATGLLAGASSARLVIATDNLSSQVVARGAGFGLTDLPVQVRRRKDRAQRMQTWQRPFPGG